ncbi:MAG: aldehyde dehydrogenase family protein, partial [Acidiferrobacterales bacterium]|nr:aldehyde dehydrogenase family protein [Acidiferrobacterales bacterium]
MDAKVKNTLYHYIGGRRVEGKSGRLGDIYNPATGEVTAQVPFASAAVVWAAVETALRAFPNWAATPPPQRAQIMFQFRDLLRQQLDELAKLLSAEHGKTFSDAQGSLTRGIEVVEFACGIP